MRLKIVQVGERVLREQARPLSPQEIGSEVIRQLIESMRETMRDAPGVGLAAPQVGLPLQLAVIEDRAEYHRSATPEQLAERERVPVEFHVIINPRIELLERPTIEHFEGCLSVSGYSAIVPRARRVRVDCLDEDGNARRIEALGWYARILQHEIDHLQGRLYIDHMHARSFMTVDNMTRYWKDLPIAEVRSALKIGS